MPSGARRPLLAIGMVAALCLVGALVVSQWESPRSTAPRDEVPRRDRTAPPPAPGSPPDGGVSVTTTASAPDAGAPPPAAPDASTPTSPAPPPPGPTVASEVQALSPDSPDEVQIVATRDVGAVRYVLFRSFPGRTWRRKRKADGTWERFREATAEIEERCADDNSSNTDAEDSCVMEHTPCRYLYGEHEDDPGAFAWEVAKLERRGEGWSLVGRRVLWGYAGLESQPDPPDELRAVDVDRDGRPEVTAIFTLYEPDTDSFMQTIWTIGMILDGGDLHTQFEVARVHAESGGDTEVNSDTKEVTWRIVDAEHDGVFELALREVSTSVQDPEEGERQESRASRTATCPYDAAADRWTCPAFGAPLPETRATITDCPTTPPEPSPASPDAGP